MLLKSKISQRNSKSNPKNQDFIKKRIHKYIYIWTSIFKLTPPPPDLTSSFVTILGNPPPSPHGWTSYVYDPLWNKVIYLHSAVYVMRFLLFTTKCAQYLFPFISHTAIFDFSKLLRNRFTLIYAKM